MAVIMSDFNRISLTAYEINRKPNSWSYINQALVWISMAKNTNLPTTYSKPPISYAHQFRGRYWVISQSERRTDINSVSGVLSYFVTNAHN
jgi:hypothetical protein